MDGYRALEPSEAAHQLVDGENVITFWYDKLTSYTVKYLDRDTNEPVAPEKVVGLDGEGNPDLPVRTEVNEAAVDVEGYTALDPTEATLELAEDGNEIIFWYEKEAPALTDYVVKYLDINENEPVAPDKVVTDVEIGSSVRERAIDVDGYRAVAPTSRTIVLGESGNEIVFWYLPNEDDPL